MKKYDMNNVKDYNQFLEETSNDDVVLFVCDCKEYESNEETILKYAEYVEEHNPECEALIALYWQDSETGEYECILYLHKMKNVNLTVETMWGNYPNCHVKFNRYSADDSLCIDLWNEEDGAIARLTVCLSEKKLKGTNRSYLDDNNCPWGEEFVEKYHLGKPVGMGFSGYCAYTLIEWDLTELEKYV